MTEYELTRRDALGALAAAGITGLGAASLTLEESGRESGLRERDVATLQAVARIVYPDEVEGVDAFVETYVVGRVTDRPAAVDGIRNAVDALDEAARTWEGNRFVDLGPATGDDLLRRISVAEADPDPAGADRERIRYYLVNEALFALYTSPTGGRLVGIENPQGYPGGTDSYQRGPGSLDGKDSGG